MEAIKTKARRRSSRPIKEACDGIKQAIAIGTAAWDPPVRVDFKKLEDADAFSLVRLTDKAAAGRGFDLTKLSRKERGEWERLVETSSPLGEGWFERARGEAKMRREFGELAREAAKPAQPSVAEQDRILRALHEHVKGGSLHLDRIAVLVYVIGQLLAADAVAPGSRIEGGGDTITLVLRRELGLGANHDPFEQFSRWEAALVQLARVGWLESVQSGSEVRVRLGPLALRAMGRSR